MSNGSRPRRVETLLVVLSRRVADLRGVLAEVRYIASTCSCANCRRIHALLSVELDRVSEVRRSGPKNEM